MAPANRLVPLADALGDHSSEGISILTAEPWRVLSALIYTMITLVLTALAWSFIGRADVIVTEQGALAPASDVRRFYAPVDGELANLYVAEGQPEVLLADLLHVWADEPLAGPEGYAVLHGVHPGLLPVNTTGELDPHEVAAVRGREGHVR